MAKPYSLANEVQSTLSAQFVHGTDTSLTLADASDFPTGGGYIRIGLAGADHWALYQYTGVSTNTLTGLTACTLGVVESEASYTFAVGTHVELTNAAEQIEDVREEISTWTGNVDADNHSLNNLLSLGFSAGGVGAKATSATRTIYVDTGGSDETGDGSASAPFATVQKAIDWYRNNANIIAHDCKVATGKGTYTLPATLDLSGLIIPASLTIEARDTSDNALYDQGTATGGTSTALSDTTKAWTTDFWANAWVFIYRGTGVGQYRQISGNTDTELTVSSAWDTAPDSTSEYVIVGAQLDGGTNSIASALAPVAQSNINVYGLYFNGFTSYVASLGACIGVSWKYNLVVSSTGRGVYVNQGRATIDYCYHDVSYYGVLAYGGAYVICYRTVLMRNGAAGTGYGAWARFQADIDMAGSTYANYIANWAIGAYATMGGIIDSGSGQTYSGNTTNYTPTGASDPAYIS